MINIFERIKKIASTTLNKFKELVSFTKYFANEFLAFNLLIFLYVINTVVVHRLHRLTFIPKVWLSRIQGGYSKMYLTLAGKLDQHTGETISKLDLIQLALRNMQVKKVRTLITIGGVSIGIGAIVFLVSLGYGLQRLVISRVARLDELRQTDVASQAGSRITIDDKTMSDIKSFTNVEEVYPLIAVVGRVNYKNSVSDMAVYGVTTGYLEKSAIKPVQGKIFESNDISVKPPKEKKEAANEPTQEVAGAKSIKLKYNEEMGKVVIKIHPNEWIRVRAGPNPSAQLLGYTKRMEGTQHGLEVAGSTYISEDTNGKFAKDEDGEFFGKWVKATVYLWDKQDCDDKRLDCVDGEYTVQRNETEAQAQKEGYMAEVNLTAYDPKAPNVLAETDTRETTESIVIGDGDWVQVVDESSASGSEAVKKVMLASSSVKKAVVNRAMLKILGIEETKAVGSVFKTSFVIPTQLMDNTTQRVESEPEEYEIIGVTPDDGTPVFYVAFVDLRSLGITKFSQLKVLAKEQEALGTIRKQIEAAGLNTQSVADTVEQITNLFATLRFVLGIMGMIALGVASLGMFNTLTISLLERSREVGLMKAMGMTTAEVQELFLTESMIMGFCAGMAGLLIGFIGGKLVSLVLTFFSVLGGQGFVDIAYIPPSFTLVIIILSFVVGMFTGIFPARRSKKISALDALRYE